MYQATPIRESKMEWTIDPRNPGEVFACAGLAHLMWITNPECKTGFEVDDCVRFVAPDITVWNERLTELIVEETTDGLRFAEEVDLDWWREWGLNSELKTWAGQQSAMTVHNSLCEAAKGARLSDWLTFIAPAHGRLNFDIPGTWNALQMGWSIDKHRKEKQMNCRPWVELLSSIGLQAFPVKGNKRQGFEYSLWKSASLPTAITAFCGYGPTIYSIKRFHTNNETNGTNTILRIATLKFT